MLTRSKLVTLLVCLVCWPALAWGQQEMRSASKGASTPLPITGSAIDADHNALDTTLRTLLSCEDQLNSVCRVESQWEYETVAASQTDQVFGTTGAAGDLVNSVKCVTSAASVGAVTIKDGTGSAITLFNAQSAASDALNKDNLNWVSTDGGWKLTTGTNTTCVISGRAN